jgi:purine nucleosidase
MNVVQQIIIDTDGGIDDALALLFALASPNTRIEAITTVHGNVPVETATANIIEILHIAGCSLPLASGCAAPLSASPVFATDVHGDDGLGGWTRTAPQCSPLVGPSASKTITSFARQFPGTITLVTIGPLTNAATALREDPEGFHLLKEIVIMGGAVEERGNVTTNAEFNLFADPQAARETLHSGIPITLVGLDVTHRVEFTRDRLDQLLGDRSDLRARFLRCLLDRMFSFYRPLLGREFLPPRPARHRRGTRSLSGRNETHAAGYRDRR